MRSRSASNSFRQSSMSICSVVLLLTLSPLHEQLEHDVFWGLHGMVCSYCQFNSIDFGGEVSGDE